MKLAPREVDRFLKAPPPDAHVVLLYGQDQGLIRARREQLLGHWVDDPGDALAVIVLTADEVRQDPARLADETRSFSMLGGRRAVRIIDAGDGLGEALKAVLGFSSVEAPVLVEAPRELAPSSGLRKLCEKESHAAAIPCYRADARDLPRLVTEGLATRGLTAEKPAIDHIAEHAGADRAVLDQALEKLALYLGEDARVVRFEDAAMCVGDSSALELDQLIHATSAGETGRALDLLDRLLAAKQTPVGIVRALANHWRRLWRLALEVERGRAADAVIEAAKPKIFFRAKPAFKRALERRRARRLRADLAALVAAERACKTTGKPADLVVRRVVLHLAAR
ncbi:MAG: DNA polymerase III subunit delta [Alphaproteobacteria bacterium]|nr:DNA polymerase III subunit delta [Alphaproteobacteria bacterium]